jgi:putative Holliday junction resolvase
MRVAAIDYGKVRVGVAVSDELGMLAHPRPYLDGKSLKLLLQALVELAKQEGIGHFLVGLPRRLDGSDSPSTRRARQFARALYEASALPVELIDEWLSTRQAQSQLREQGVDAKSSREKIDSAAAAVLLQSWLDSPLRRRHLNRRASSELGNELDSAAAAREVDSKR